MAGAAVNIVEFTEMSHQRDLGCEWSLFVWPVLQWILWNMQNGRINESLDVNVNFDVLFCRCRSGYHGICVCKDVTSATSWLGPDGAEVLNIRCPVGSWSFVLHCSLLVCSLRELQPLRAGCPGAPPPMLLAWHIGLGQVGQSGHNIMHVVLDLNMAIRIWFSVSGSVDGLCAITPLTACRDLSHIL